MLRVSDRAGSKHVLRLTSYFILPSDIATSWASQLIDFAAQWLACRCPLSTLRSTPRDVQRMTRGLSDSPFLPSIELSSTTNYRLLLAHSYFYKRRGRCFRGEVELGGGLENPRSSQRSQQLLISSRVCLIKLCTGQARRLNDFHCVPDKRIHVQVRHGRRHRLRLQVHSVAGSRIGHKAIT